MVRMEAPSQTLSVMSDKLQNVSRQTLEGLKQTTFLYINYHFYTFIFSVVSAAERWHLVSVAHLHSLSTAVECLDFWSNISLWPQWINPLGGPEVNMSCRLPLASCPLWTVYSITFKHPSKHKAHQITHGSLIILSRTMCQKLECLISYYFQWCLWVFLISVCIKMFREWISVLRAFVCVCI